MIESNFQDMSHSRTMTNGLTLQSNIPFEYLFKKSKRCILTDSRYGLMVMPVLSNPYMIQSSLHPASKAARQAGVGKRKDPNQGTRARIMQRTRCSPNSTVLTPCMSRQNCGASFYFLHKNSLNADAEFGQNVLKKNH